MILKPTAFIQGHSFDLKTRLENYKKYRKPKRVKPLDSYTAFICCYGDLRENYFNQENLKNTHDGMEN